MTNHFCAPMFFDYSLDMDHESAGKYMKLE